MEKWSGMIEDPELSVIEDASPCLLAPATGMERKWASCKWSQMTVFSFHPAKQDHAGEGGMVLTNDEELFQQLKLYRNNGIVRRQKFIESAPWYYEVQDLTGNFHLTEFQAALGLSQLKRLDTIVEKTGEN